MFRRGPSISASFSLPGCPTWPTFNVPGVFFIRHHMPELEDAGGGRERTDAERIEEVGRQAYEESKMDGTPGARSLLRNQIQTRKTVKEPRAIKSQSRALSITRCYRLSRR